MIYKWPLALDLLKRQYDALFSDHALERFSEVFDIAKTVRIDLFGATGYFTIDPENIEAILSTRFEDYSLGSRRLATFALLGEGIFGQDGPAWKRSRELIRRQFIRVRKQDLQVFTPPINGLISYLRQTAAAGRAVDLKPSFFQYTLDTTTELLFGEPQSNLPKGEQDAVRDNFDYATFGIGVRVRLGALAWLYNPAKYRRACQAIKDWASLFAKEAIRYIDDVGEEQASQKYPFIVDLWKETRDEQLVRDQLLHTLVAGRDSTADLLCWTL